VFCLDLIKVIIS